MVEKDLVWKGKLKHTGIIDSRELYTFCYKWLTDEDYFIVEKVYNEKITKDGKEVEIKWFAFRKISDYFRFYLKIDWRIILTPVEAIKNGGKVKAEKGILEIKIDGVLEKDYEHRWENNGFLKFLRGVYDRYMIRTRVEQYEERLMEEVNEFIAQCKSLLAIETKHEPIKETKY